MVKLCSPRNTQRWNIHIKVPWSVVGSPVASTATSHSDFDRAPAEDKAHTVYTLTPSTSSPTLCVHPHSNQLSPVLEAVGTRGERDPPSSLGLNPHFISRSKVQVERSKSITKSNLHSKEIQLYPPGRRSGHICLRHIDISQSPISILVKGLLEVHKDTVTK